ncbi:BREX-1 system adenine-specific DNA-methyltransferase PglX, partial [Ligilactobacillus equi]
RTNQANFGHIDGSPLAYWLPLKTLYSFTNKKIIDVAEPRLGMATASNTTFVRFWYEVSKFKINFAAKSRLDASDSKKKWFPYNKGGEYRKWFGNDWLVVNWENDGSEIQNFKDNTGKIRSHNYNLSYIFRPGITWNALTSGNLSSRITKSGFLFDNAGSKLFVKDDNFAELKLIQASLSSKAANYIFKAINPTINYQPGTIGQLPIVFENYDGKTVEGIVDLCMTISKLDWDSYEDSWNFNFHPLIQNIDEHEKEKLVPLLFLTSKPP